MRCAGSLILATLLLMHADYALALCTDGDLGQVESGIRWCAAQCQVPNSKDQCDASGKMSQGANDNDVNAIREGFERCHKGSASELATMQTCVSESGDGVLFRARRVYGLNKAAVPPACDRIQLTINLVWCWQDTGDEHHFPCDFFNKKQFSCAHVQVAHQDYVDNIADAYQKEDWQRLRGIYSVCQSHNKDALKHLVSCNKAEDIMAAARHTIGCYRPIPKGGRIKAGENANWNEAKKTGLTTCKELE